MGKKNFFSNIFYKILELFGDIIKYILTKMSPIHPTRKNDKFTNCWFSLNSNIKLDDQSISRIGYNYILSKT